MRGFWAVKTEMGPFDLGLLSGDFLVDRKCFCIFKGLIITFLVGNPYKPSFATVTGWGVDPMYIV